MCCSSYSCAPRKKPAPPPEPHPYRYSLFPVDRAMPELFPRVDDGSEAGAVIDATFPRAFPDEVERFIALTLLGAASTKAMEMGKESDVVWSAVTWDFIDRQISFWWRPWHFRRQMQCLLWMVTLGFRGAPMRASHRWPLSWLQWILPGRDQAVLHVKAALGRLHARKLLRPCLHRSAGRMLNLYEPLPGLVELLNASAPK